MLAVNYTINAYKKWETNPNYRGYARLFVFITDGRPYPREPPPAESPCPIVKKLNEVVDGNVVIVGLGNRWRLRDIECMITPDYDYNNIDPSAVYDPKRVIEVPDWSPGTLYTLTLFIVA